MPTYGYQCKACGHRFEVIQKMTDPALTDCENCGGLVKKVLYPVGIAFKGSGFYVNDYAKPAPAAASGPKADGASTETPEAKPTTETKIEPSSAAAPAATTGAPTEPAGAGKA